MMLGIQSCGPRPMAHPPTSAIHIYVTSGIFVPPSPGSLTGLWESMKAAAEGKGGAPDISTAGDFIGISAREIGQR